MRLEQLEYVAAITDMGSLRRASEALHLSQSAMSEAVAKLEHELGVKLLSRLRSGSRMSEEGRQLLPLIHAVLEAAETLRAEAQDRERTSRVLRIGSVGAGTASFVLPAIKSFQDASARSTIEVSSLIHDDVERGLLEGTLDLGVVNLLDDDQIAPELDRVDLATGTPVVVLPVGHQLGERESVTPAELRAERFVGMRQGFVMYRYVRRLFADDLPAHWNAIDGAELGKLMVATGGGVTVLPDYSVIDDPLERAGLIVTRPIAAAPVRLTLSALHVRHSRLPHDLRLMLGQLCRQPRLVPEVVATP